VSTQLVRPLDSVRRVGIPKDFCSALHLSAGDPVVLTLDKDSIVLRKANPDAPVEWSERVIAEARKMFEACQARTECDGECICRNLCHLFEKE
jgi:bifunctional DNA-binding transcriptional regulator/antitoxin component of YhaV-PrlF toxin-antitoxin module